MDARVAIKGGSPQRCSDQEGGRGSDHLPPLPAPLHPPLPPLQAYKVGPFPSSIDFVVQPGLETLRVPVSALRLCSVCADCVLLNVRAEHLPTVSEFYVNQGPRCLQPRSASPGVPAAFRATARGGSLHLFGGGCFAFLFFFFCFFAFDNNINKQKNQHCFRPYDCFFNSDWPWAHRFLLSHCQISICKNIPF